MRLRGAMMAANTIRRKIGLLFLAFFTLVTASVAATFWGIQMQKEDALVINLAGRQRMLTQKITWLALAQPESPELDASVQLFEQTLHALRYGGLTRYGIGNPPPLADEMPVVRLPAASEAALRADLDRVAHLWDDFRSHLQPLDVAALQAQSPVLLGQLDALVSHFEARARAKLLRVQIIQALSFVCALALLGLGYFVTRRQILHPLAQLQAAAQRMAQGQLEQPLPPMGEDELGQVAQAFEAMRQEVAASHQELEARVAQRTQELAAAFEFSQEIVTHLDLERLLSAVAERARALAHARSAALCLLDEDGTHLLLTASSGEPIVPLNLRQNLQRDPAYQVVTEGQTVTLCADCAQCGFLMAHHPGQCAVAPLRADNLTLGALCVVRNIDEPFDADESRALTLLANVAAIAIINARLAENGRRQAAQTAVLSERERLAGELHDNLAQTLGFLNLRADQMQRMLSAGQTQAALGELDRIKQATQVAYDQVRAALIGLTEPLPATDDFVQRLSASLEEMSQKSGLHIELQIADASALRLPRLTQAQALLILREAITNVCKHAWAHTVHVRVERDDGQARFVVEDDGIGFDPQVVVSREHLGLRLMRARAERSGGSLLVESAPGAGTRVTVCFPLDESA
jgi:two-component system nitrate/nitrite sensor histidine kinase NarX